MLHSIMMLNKYILTYQKVVTFTKNSQNLKEEIFLLPLILQIEKLYLAFNHSRKADEKAQRYRDIALQLPGNIKTLFQISSEML